MINILHLTPPQTMFTSSYNARINTVNCMGVMGKGLALAFKNRYHDMFIEYREDCYKRIIKPGVIKTYRVYDGVVINFPTKIDWKMNSEYEYIEKGLDELILVLKNLAEEYGADALRPYTVAIPKLGCSNGNLDWEIVKPKILSALSKIDDDFYVFDIYENEVV